MHRISASLILLSLVSGLTASADEFVVNGITTSAERLNVYRQISICLEARSALVDTKALGGFAPSTNAPRQVEPHTSYANNGIQLVALPKESELFEGSYAGFAVLLVNGSPNTRSFGATDSCLPIIREALDTDGQWKPIELLPRSWCGNSYHRVFLPSGQYWRFAAPLYSGVYETKMRFKLLSSPEIVSNEFRGTMNREQFPRRIDSGTRRTISSSELKQLPVDNIQGAIALQPGVVVTPR